MLRAARATDIPAIQRVRASVAENRLVSTVITDEDVRAAIEDRGRGYGRQLHDTMVDWLWAAGLDRLWLTTEPGTRAQLFYEAAGWQLSGTTDHGELQYELARR